MAIEIAAVLIPLAIVTVTGSTIVSPTAQVEELKLPIVVVMFDWAWMLFPLIKVKTKKAKQKLNDFFIRLK